jgi:hypothetical protein
MTTKTEIAVGDVVETLGGTATVRELNDGGALIKHNMPAGNGQAEWMLKFQLGKPIGVAGHCVKIGKTVYGILEKEHSEAGCVVYVIKKANTQKTLIYSPKMDTYTLWSGRVGLPKYVNPQFGYRPEDFKQ